MPNSPASSSSKDRIVWIDCEMTGLDLSIDELVEVAVVVTDSNLRILDPGFQIVIKPSDAALAHMDDFVTKMHTTSGLIEEIPNGVSLAEATEQVLNYVRRFVPDASTAPLGGNTIGTDRMFLAKYMRELDEYLHYRNIDVSSLKELSRRWFPRVYFQSPSKAGGHRALADILESIRELEYYRRALLITPPGPTTNELKVVSGEVTDDFKDSIDSVEDNERDS